MGRVYYNKLVRDNIQHKILSNGEECEVRKITDAQEFEQELLKKVVEEAQGLAQSQSRDSLLDEYADLMAVLDALIQLHEFREADIKRALRENIEKKGLFNERHFLHWSSDGKYQSNETPQGTHENKLIR